MKHPDFTKVRVAGFACPPGKKQHIFWDGNTRGLGLRVTAAGAKSYIFETSLNGKTLRITIGDVNTYEIAAARKEAASYKADTNKDIDPRQVRADELAFKKAEQEARQAQQLRESVTLGDIWPIYVADRVSEWSAHHIEAHARIIQAGGEKWKRGKRITRAGPLATLASVRLIDLTMPRIEAWAKVEVVSRPSSARLALRLLKACLNWCAAHVDYAGIITVNPAKSTKARESLGKSKVRNDVLQKEQVSAWFAAVRQIENPVISAYLQSLLLTGARREELAHLRWADVDFQWNSMTIRDKMEGLRTIPLTPYVAHLLGALPRRNAWVFSSTASEAGNLSEPRYAHNQATVSAGLPHLSLHGLRRSFASLSEWTKTPAGIAAQIQGHAPQGVREQNYIRREIDLLRGWHVTIEAWILEQAGIKFVPPVPAAPAAPACT
jgi:integrase